jgi:hypothetical protein
MNITKALTCFGFYKIFGKLAKKDLFVASSLTSSLTLSLMHTKTVFILFSKIYTLTEK